jgi:VWFA-related protein
VILRVAVLIGVLVLLVPGLPARAQHADQPPRFTSAVDVVSVTAVVRDRRGRFVRDLERRDFTVFEGGEARPLLDVRVEVGAPVRIALLIDVSGSMRIASKAVDARVAALQIFNALGPRDEVALYAFDTKLERVANFTSDVARLEAALDEVVPPFGQTSLYDAVAKTAQDAVARTAGGAAGDLKSIAGPDAAPQRLAVVVLTDGIDTSSRFSPQQVSGIASVIDVPVYVLAVMFSIDDPSRFPAGQAASSSSELGSLSRWTGGELFTASSPVQSDIAARRIIDELRHQYVLAFEASTQPGWRPVEVRSRNRGHVVRVRAGYMAGGTGA